MKLIEKSGFSFSGLTELLRNSDNNEKNCKEILIEIDIEYNDAIAEYKALEKQLDKAKQRRGQMVNMFLLVNKIVKSDNNLTFQYEDNVVVVDIKDENTIDYQKFTLTNLFLF